MLVGRRIVSRCSGAPRAAASVRRGAAGARVLAPRARRRAARWFRLPGRGGPHRAALEQRAGGPGPHPRGRGAGEAPEQPTPGVGAVPGWEIAFWPWEGDFRRNLCGQHV